MKKKPVCILVNNATPSLTPLNFRVKLSQNFRFAHQVYGCDAFQLCCADVDDMKHSHRATKNVGNISAFPTLWAQFVTSALLPRQLMVRHDHDSTLMTLHLRFSRPNTAVITHFSAYYDSGNLHFRVTLLFS